jgi:hypothetical protein
MNNPSNPKWLHRRVVDNEVRKDSPESHLLVGQIWPNMADPGGHRHKLEASLYLAQNAPRNPHVGLVEIKGPDFLNVVLGFQR